MKKESKTPGLQCVISALQRGCLGWSLAVRLVLGAAGVIALCVFSRSSAFASGSYAAAALSDNPVAFWQLTETDDASGGVLSANDSSGNGHHGLYGITSQNGFNGIPSPQPPAFPGFTNGHGGLETTAPEVNSPVSVPSLNLNINTVTITMWINPSGGQNLFTGLFMNRDAADAAGLGVGGTSNSSGMAELGYTWNMNSAATWNFKSGLYPRADTWNFVALVIQFNSATLYPGCPNAGQVYLGSVVNAMAHTPEAFASGTTLIGDNVSGSSADPYRVFNGDISDVAGVNGTTSPISYQWKLNGTRRNHEHLNHHQRDR